VDGLDVMIDDITDRFDAPTEFVIPGQNETAARLDLARTVVRRAERESLAAHVEGSQVIPYLNRLSDLVWTLARWQEGEAIEAKQSRSDS
jgi:cob(I)alamin adenosyltransferase